MKLLFSAICITLFPLAALSAQNESYQNNLQTYRTALLQATISERDFILKQRDTQVTTKNTQQTQITWANLRSKGTKQRDKKYSKRNDVAKSLIWLK